MLLPKNKAEPVKHLGQFWVGITSKSGSVFGRRQQDYTSDCIGLSASASYSTGGSNQTKDDNGNTITGTGPGGIKTTNQGNAGARMGATSMGAASESDSSTTRSGISGATLTIGTKTTQTDKGQTATDSSGKAINTGVTTGIDTAAKLAKPSSLEDIQAQVQITQSFGSQASKAVGDYAAQQMSKANQLNAQAAQTTDPQKKADLQAQADAINGNWGDYGTLRIAAHAAIGGLTGGTDGAVGAATGTITAPAVAVAKALNDAGISR